jgi:glycosyltransferase involved in cell wall biosynthesis
MTRLRADILIDARLLAYRRGGIARYVAGLTRWLPRVAPDLAFRRIVNRETSKDSRPYCRVFTPPHFRFERLTLGLECAARRPALLHSPDFIAPAAFGVRRIVTVHDLAFLKYPELLAADARRYYQQIERSISVAERVIAVSDYTANQLRELTDIDEGKIVTIPNGIEPPVAENQPDDVADCLRSELSKHNAALLLGDRPIVLVVGTIEPRKRQQLILQALAQPTLVGGTEPLVVLVGQRGWACEPIVEEIDRAVATGHAIWLQNVSDRLLAALYQHATLLAMPSLDEGFGLPVLEAMAAGLPVVAARRGALPEVAGKAALFVESDEPADWAEAIGTLMASESRLSVLRCAGRRRAGQFSWERTARETAALYHEVLTK